MTSSGEGQSLDRDALSAALQRLEGLELTDTLDEALANVVTTAASLTGVAGCGLMFIDDSDALRYVAASDGASRALEHAQVELGHGPCVDAFVQDRVVIAADLQSDDRWPGLAERLADSPIRSVVGVPVHLGGAAIGSLDAYLDTTHYWSETQLRALQAFNGVVEALIASALLAKQQSTLVAQLQYALDHRVMIERAVGLIMGTSGVGAVDAFNRLRGAARTQRRRVAELAEDLLEGRTTLPT